MTKLLRPEAVLIGAETMQRLRRNHSPAFKATVALAVIRSDRTLAELAEHFEVRSNRHQPAARAGGLVEASCASFLQVEACLCHGAVVACHHQAIGVLNRIARQERSDIKHAQIGFIRSTGCQCITFALAPRLIYITAPIQRRHSIIVPFGRENGAALSDRIAMRCRALALPQPAQTARLPGREE